MIVCVTNTIDYVDTNYFTFNICNFGKTYKSIFYIKVNILKKCISVEYVLASMNFERNVRGKKKQIEMTSGLTNECVIFFIKGTL